MKNLGSIVLLLAVGAGYVASLPVGELPTNEVRAIDGGDGPHIVPLEVRKKSKGGYGSGGNSTASTANKSRKKGKTGKGGSGSEGNSTATAGKDNGTYRGHASEERSASADGLNVASMLNA
ncbi:unnamed protein product [Discula destructiva]